MRFIPRVIHLIWFGRNPYSPIVIKCINSWKNYCPDYTIKLWNEDNFDITCNSFVKEAYEAKKWAFVSDYVRLYALLKEGGVYIDSDCELVRSFDQILEDEHVVTGYSSSNWIPTGFMAAERGNPWIEMLLHYYDNRHFVLPNGRYDMKVNNVIITEESTKKCGFRTGDMWIEYGKVKLYPRVYFHPYPKRVVDWSKDDINKVRKYYKIDMQKTVCIHYGTGTWVADRNKGFYKVKHLVRRILPQQIIEPMERIYYRIHNWSNVE